MPVQWTVATRPPPPVSASRFLNCSARVPLVAWLSAGCAANAAAKPAAAQSSLLCTRSGLARRTPASPGARSHTRRLASHPCVPPRRPGTASSALAPSRRFASARPPWSDRRPALSVARRPLAQMPRLVAEEVAASWPAPCHARAATCRRSRVRNHLSLAYAPTPYLALALALALALSLSLPL